MKPLLFLLISSPLIAGSFPGAAGSAGSDAISKDSPAFVAWANGNHTVNYGSGVDGTWQTPWKGLGPATGDAMDIVCLGNGGNITLFFPRPIRDGAGPDFAVFENAFSPGFLELAYVEVSSDGANFYRFTNRSEGTSLVGAFAATMNPTNLYNLAGKHVKGFGTPFDIASLPDTPALDRQNIRFVRILDIVGNGSAKDSFGYSIYDPTPTTGSGGFDLDGVGVIHQNTDPIIVEPAAIQDGAFRFAWVSNPGGVYRIESSTDMMNWSAAWAGGGWAYGYYSQILFPLDGSPSKFYRVIRTGP